MKMFQRLEQWIENPTPRTHSLLVQEMMQVSARLDKAGCGRNKYFDDGTSEGYFIHPELRSAFENYFLAKKVLA